MDFEHIEYEVADRIATIAMNRPDKLNAGTPRMIRELLTAIDLVDADDEVRAVIFTGRGRAFCAGADLAAAGGSTFDYDRQRREGGEDLSNVDPEVAELRQRDGAGLVTLRLFDCTKPVISAVNGPAVGMGVTMTLATDIRMASETARFGFVFTQRGIVPEGASSWFLPRVVGLSQALEWLYTGRVFDAAEALRGGLVRSVHAPDELLPAARALATEFAQGAPLSVALTRRMVWRMLGADHPMAAHRVDSRAVRATGQLPDAMEGVTSFLEKRSPEFTGKVSAGLPEVFPDWHDPTFS